MNMETNVKEKGNKNQGKQPYKDEGKDGDDREKEGKHNPGDSKKNPSDHMAQPQTKQPEKPPRKQAKTSSSAPPKWSSSLSATVEQLKNSDKDRVYEALVWIRKKFIKEKDGVARLCRYGGVNCLLNILQGTSQKLVDVALSILGNICMQDKARKQVMNLQGIEIIGKIIQNIEVTTIQNRACRCLGNLAQDPSCCSLIHQEEDLVALVVKLLSSTEDVDCQQTYIRTLRLFGDTASHRRDLLHAEALQIIANLLLAEDKNVRIGAMKTVQEMTNEFSVEHARQLINADAPASLFKLCTNSDSLIAQTAFSMIIKWVKHEGIRTAIGSAGGVQIFIQLIRKGVKVNLGDEDSGATEDLGAGPSCIDIDDTVDVCASNADLSSKSCAEEGVTDPIEEDMSCINEGGIPQLNMTITSSTQLMSVINALCLCCHDVVNRVKIKDCDGLSLIMTLLKSRKCQVIHDRLLSALLCFMYDSDSVDDFLSLGLVPVLIRHLRRVARLGPPTEETDLFFIAEGHLDDQVIVESCLGDASTPKTSQLLGSGCNKFMTPIPASGTDSHIVLETPGQNKKVIAALGECDQKDNHSDQQDVDFSTCEDKELEETSLNILGTSQSVGKEYCFSEVNQILLPKEELSCPLKDGILEGESQTGENEPSTSIKDRPKYSIDSPTYQNMSEWKFEDYFVGPKNLRDSLQVMQLCDTLAPYESPPHDGPYSPMSMGSSYVSPCWSPECSPRAKLGPGINPQFSPNLNFDNASPEYNFLNDMPNIQWSPGETVGPMSPGSDSTECSQSSPWWCGPCKLGEHEEEQYSSAEEIEPDSGEKFSNDVNEVGGKESAVEVNQFPSPTSLKEDGYKELGGSDVQKNQELIDLPSSPTLSAFLNIEHTLNKEPDMEKLEGVEPPRKRVRTVSPRGDGKSRRRSLTPDVRDKILKSLTRQTSSSVDLNKIMTSNEPNTPMDDFKNVEFPSNKDPRRITEYNILVLLSRISYLDDPTSHMINWICLTGLLDYVTKATDSFPRCARIITRLVKNRRCFEAIVLQMVPATLFVGLLDVSVTEIQLRSEKQLERSEDKDSLIGKKLNATPVKAIQGLSLHGNDRGIHGMVRSQSAPSVEAMTKNGHSDRSKSKLKGNAKPSGNEQRELKKVSEAKKLCETLMDNMALVASSRFGLGELAHILLAGTEVQKQCCAVSLPFICRGKEMHHKMFLDYQALHLLLDAALQHSSPALQGRALHSLVVLAKAIGLAVVKSTEEKVPQRRISDEDIEKDMVTFVLDDGLAVKGQRTAMASGSPVFAAMLEGHYSEAKQSEVNIKDVSHGALQILVDHIHGKSLISSKERHSSYCEDQSEVDVLHIFIEALALGDRYLMPEFQKAAGAMITKEFLCSEKVVSIAMAAANHDCTWLLNQAVTYILTEVLPLSSALSYLKGLLQGNHSCNIRNRIIDIVNLKLS